jgi:TolB-like protein/DNA-binding winged helix-turn-helix (wHTH) protein/Tfp pilus assembly protein PilF
LRCAGKELPLRPKSFDVLHYLACNRGRVVSKDELMQAVWPDVFVTDNSLAQCISEVREALGEGAHVVLKTVARRGYLFAAEVDGTEDAPPVAERDLAPQPAFLTAASRPVAHYLAIIAMAALVAGGGWWIGQSLIPENPIAPASHADDVSIAVLPFVTLGGTSADDYFARGLTEDITVALGRFAGLSVLSAKAVARYDGKSVTPQQIGRDLKARYLVSGSVRRNSGRIRIVIELVNTADSRLIWADQYDRDATGIFEIQDDITRRITGALAVRVSTVEQARAVAKPPGNLEAYDLVLRGRDSLSRLTRAATSNARVLFEQAIALDQNYAPAYVGLGMADLRAFHHGWTAEPAAALQRVKDHALKAIALDESNPHAHALLGRVYARLHDYERAVDALRRAMALNPSDSDNHAGLGDALLWSGDVAGAIAALETADRLDPQLSTQDLFNLGTAYFLAGDDVRAAQVFERAAARNEGNAFVQAMLAAIYQDAGRGGEARRAIAEMRRLNPFFDMGLFGSLFRNSAHRDKIVAALRRAAS